MPGNSVIGLLRILLALNTTEYEAGAKKATDVAKNLKKEFASIGQQATQLGTTLTTALTLPLVGVAAGAAKAAIDFESAFAGVRKTVNATEPEFQAMSDAFRGLAKQIPISVNELARLGESAGALGIHKEDIVEFTRVMGLLGVTTNLTSEQAADAIARIQNIFGAAGKDTARLASTLVALGNAGASTESEIVEMAQRIAGAGHTIGLTQAQVLGFASALASVGINAEAGGSAISRVFLKMNDAVAKGGGALDEFARVAKKSAADFKHDFETNAAGAVVEFIQGLGKLKASGENVNQTIEGLTGKNIILKDTLFRLAGAGTLLSDQLKIGNQAWKDNTALTNEAEQRFKTTAAQVQLLWNQIKDLGITIGNALLPVIRSTVQVMGQLLPIIDTIAKAFVALPVPIQATAIGVAAAAAAAGPLLIIFGQMASASSVLVGAFTAQGLATRALGLNLTALTTAWTVLNTPITVSTASMGVNAVVVGTLNAAYATMAGTLNALKVAILAMPWAALAAGIGVVTVALTNWYEAANKAKLANETLGAKQDSINLAIARGATFLTDIRDKQEAYTKAIQFNAEWDEKRRAGIVRTTSAEANLAKGLKDSGDALKSAQQQIDQLSTAARTKLVDAIKSGAFSLKQLQEMSGLSETALKLLEHQLKSTATTAKAAQKDFDSAAKAGVAAYKANVAAIKAVHDQLTDIARKGAAGDFSIVDDQELAKLHDSVDLTVTWIKFLKDGIPVIATNADTLSDALTGLGRHVDVAFSPAKLTQVQKFGNALAQTVLQAVTGGGNLAKSIGALLGQSIFEVGGEATKFAKTLGSKLVGLFGSTIGGALNAVLPGIGSLLGTLLGNLAGKVGGFFKKLFGGGSAGRDLVKEFAQSVTGSSDLNALHALLTEKLPQDAERFWVALTQGSAHGNPERAKAVIAEVTAALAAADHQTQEFDSSLGGLLGQLREMGVGVPDAIRPLLEGLANAKNLSTDTLGLISSLLNQQEVDWHAVEAAVGRYGGDISKLGGSFQSARLHESWQEVIDDVELFQKAGIDAADIQNLIKDRLNELVQQSFKFGTEIPENMRPWIEKLIASGELLDENGQKITDISKLTFGATLQSSVEKLTKAIQNLIKTLGGIPDALDDIPKEVNVDVNVHEKHTKEDTPGDTQSPGTPSVLPGGTFPTPEELGLPTFARGSGGLRNFGSGRLAVLHGVEEVRTADQKRRDDAARMSDADATPQVVVHVDQRGSFFDSEQGAEKMMRTFFRSLKNGGANYGDFQYFVRQVARGTA